MRFLSSFDGRAVFVVGFLCFIVPIYSFSVHCPAFGVPRSSQCSRRRFHSWAARASLEGSESAGTGGVFDGVAEAERPDIAIDEFDEDDFDGDDKVVSFRPKAVLRMKALIEESEDGKTALRMGVRSGGCSGLSYVMDFVSSDEITEEDVVDTYDEIPGLLCVVDPKSMLYLYGMELDYSDELIGGGFQFHNPNAEESCGCGKSFGV